MYLYQKRKALDNAPIHLMFFCLFAKTRAFTINIYIATGATNAYKSAVAIAIKSITVTTIYNIFELRSNKTGKAELEKKQKFQTSFFGERYVLAFYPWVTDSIMNCFINVEIPQFPLSSIYRVATSNGHSHDPGILNFEPGFDPDKMQKLNCFKVVFARKIKTTYNEK
ncbi:hypothetical protein RhiirA1_522206 [Rhizophagus irregularis]|uniref:Uncharacterized protein n=1 Tax=Rhizophagus irregularis TaxID=588596 RepID=A0A2N0SCV5_9GLOM|nr:hypothetical protein RhiirA1_522206 [Rhizophagus irregularis]